MHKGPVALASLIALGASLMLLGNTAAGDSVPLTACQKKLNHNSYQCDVETTDNPGNTFSECFTVSPQTPNDEMFTLGPFLFTTWTCECNATGEPGDADFGDSPSKFVCGGNFTRTCGSPIAADGLHGEISGGGKALDLQGIATILDDSNGPHSFVATCEKVKTCEH